MQRHEKCRAQITEYSNAASRCHTSNKALQAKSRQHLNTQYCPRSWVTVSCCAQPGAHCDPVGSKAVHNTQAAPGAVLLSLHSRKNFICSQFAQTLVTTENGIAKQRRREIPSPLSKYKIYIFTTGLILFNITNSLPKNNCWMNAKCIILATSGRRCYLISSLNYRLQHMNIVYLLRSNTSEAKNQS